ncbi:hypothetical protein NE172_14010 [Clostridium botulinum]|uniref:Uncharacterized protein n=1 Tax=Clostridium botulinum TaxID=1491 RepID=A0A6B4JMF0_CLOBO|nr:hypothetical protein [Clostridium botulinum]EES50618.1 hypothetical protein CLO_2148 [Clostridium botulinum E1 str. 'BoNT E Beluga']MBY6761145.1 hypothetical protein [Clostridium botulinum]MBY6921377.1 hypothetical protein [Clostridium botulinum]MCR1132054.1 hypothetical protein [Clostridium botulinum]NFJ57825.1 hypothetical protein [Clostridium botulinum]
MIIINTLEDIEKADITPLELKKEILQHFQEIAESVVDKYWKMYNLKDKQSKKITSIPEFTEIIVIGDVEIIKSTFILGDSFGITLYHKIGKLGIENEDLLNQYKI